MKFQDFICFDAIVPRLESGDRDGVIGELVAALEQCGNLSESESKQVRRALIKRENEASTGMGKGVAIPHVKHKSVDRVIGAVGQSAIGIDFAALDKQPVYSVILLVSPVGDSEQHLKAMEKVFKHLQQEKFRKFLRQSETVEEIKDLLMEADERAFV